MKKVKPTFSLNHIAQATGLNRDGILDLQSIIMKDVTITTCPGHFRDDDAKELAVSYLHPDWSLGSHPRGKIGKGNSFSLNLGSSLPSRIGNLGYTLPGTDISGLTSLKIIKTYPWSDQYEISAITYKGNALPTSATYDQDFIESLFGVFKEFHDGNLENKRTNFSQAFKQPSEMLIRTENTDISRDFESASYLVQHQLAKIAFRLQIA